MYTDNVEVLNEALLTRCLVLRFFGHLLTSLVLVIPAAFEFLQRHEFIVLSNFGGI